MNNNTLLILVLAVGIWWYVSHNQPATVVVPNSTAIPSPGNAAASLAIGGPPASTNNGSAPSTLQSLESAASSYTHVPLATVGHLATASPTWLKLAVFPVGVTAVAQDVINNPKAALKSVGGFASTAGKDTAKVTVKTVKAAGAAAGKVGGALESGAKSATHAVSSGVHKVLSFL